MRNASDYISTRAHAVDASGIRKVFDLAAKMKDPINLSIGLPDFDVPEIAKSAAIDAIRAGHNRYTPTQGIEPLRVRLREHLNSEIGRDVGEVLITSGVTAVLMADSNPNPWPVVPAIGAGLLVGAVVGLVNGLLIEVAGISPVIATLGTLIAVWTSGAWLPYGRRSAHGRRCATLLEKNWDATFVCRRADGRGMVAMVTIIHNLHASRNGASEDNTDG